jgi:hypothetical protein
MSSKKPAEELSKLILVSCLAYFLTLKMEALCSSESLDLSELHCVNNVQIFGNGSNKSKFDSG